MSFKDKQDYRDGKISWNSYLCKQFLENGNLDIFHDLLKLGRIKLLNAGADHNSGKITIREFIKIMINVVDETERILFNNGISIGMSTLEERKPFLLRHIKILSNYPGRTELECSAKEFEASLIGLEWLDFYFDKYVPRLNNRKLRIIDIYDNNADQIRAAQSTEYSNVRLTHLEELKYEKQLP